MANATVAGVASGITTKALISMPAVDVQYVTLTQDSVYQATFANRYSYVQLSFVSGAADVYIRTDGVNPTLAGAEAILLPSGAVEDGVLLANDLAYWYQGYGGPGGSLNPSNPGTDIRMITHGSSCIVAVQGVG